MTRDDRRPFIGQMLYWLGLACVVALILSIPAVWLSWEAAEAQARANLVTDAAAMRARDGLRDMFSRFERATATLRAQDLRGDAVTLTGRLLRAEPSIAPASGLVVIDNRG